MPEDIRTIVDRLKLNMADGFAELDAALLEQDRTQSIVRVRSGDNLAGLMETAPAGQVFSIDPDFKHVGALEIGKPCTLQSAAFMPTERIGPDLVGPSITGKLYIHESASDVTFRNIRHLGNGGYETMAEVYGDRFVLDRSLMLGGVNGQKRGLLPHATGVRVLKSHIGGIFWPGYGDTQAIAAVRDCHDLLVDDSFLEAAGEVVLFGGDDIGAESSMCSDVHVRNSTLTKRLAWRDIPGVAKNLYELKAVRGASLTGCFLANSFKSAQDGFAVVLTVRNQNGRDPFATVQDVLISGNSIAHVVGGFNILGRDDILQSEAWEANKGQVRASERMRNIQILDNVVRDISRHTWGEGLGGRLFQIQGGPADLVVDGLNVEPGLDRGDGRHEGDPAVSGAIYFDQAHLPLSGFRFSNSMIPEGEYGIHSSFGLGTLALDKFAPGYVWKNQTVKRQGLNPVKWPAGTIFA